MSDLFAEHVGATVKETIEETVEACARWSKDEVSVSEIAKSSEA